MTLKEQVTTLLEAALANRTDLFLIDFLMDDQNKIVVVIDGDQGVTLSDCVEISRAIEHNIDREVFDFSLEVASPGATSPIVNNRQYQKNIGRTIEIKQTDGQVLEGVLADISNEGIQLSWSSREPKKIGKGKETVVNHKDIAFTEIKKAQVIIKI